MLYFLRINYKITGLVKMNINAPKPWWLCFIPECILKFLSKPEAASTIKTQDEGEYFESDSVEGQLQEIGKSMSSYFSDAEPLSREAIDAAFDYRLPEGEELSSLSFIGDSEVDSLFHKGDSQ